MGSTPFRARLHPDSVFREFDSRIALAARPASVWAMITDAAARNPDGDALICGDKRLSWRELVTQSADIAAGLAKQMTIEDAVAAAKKYVTDAIKTAPRIGRGATPL